MPRSVLPWGFCILTTLATLVAQPLPPPTPVTIPAAERRLLKSKITGTEYQIDVALPRDYALQNGKPNEQRYPVFYTLDGNAYFALATDTVRLLHINRLIPDDLIVVGVGYAAQTYAFWGQPYMASRTHDYGTKPTGPPDRVEANMTQAPGDPGGAPDFLRFLREELIPYIDATYRTVPGDRALSGHSFGGLFAAYVLTHQPEAFRRYAIGSPSLWWDDEVAFRWEAEYAAAHKDLAARVYLFVGGWEADAMQDPTREFWQRLQTRHYAGLEGGLAVVPEETHLSVNLAALEHAIRGLYALPPVPITADTLRRYAGEWKAATGAAWRVRIAGGRLALEDALGRARDLYPQTDGSFATYAGAVGGFRLEFLLDDAGRSVTGLRLSRPPYLEAGQFHPGDTLMLRRADAPAEK